MATPSNMPQRNESQKPMKIDQERWNAIFSKKSTDKE